MSESDFQFSVWDSYPARYLYALIFVFQFSVWDSCCLLTSLKQRLGTLSILCVRFCCCRHYDWFKYHFTFNSLCEIHKAGRIGCMRAASVFQFSVWDSSLRDKASFTKICVFQFSVWDSGVGKCMTQTLVEKLSILCVRFLNPRLVKQLDCKGNFQFSVWDSIYHQPTHTSAARLSILCVRFDCIKRAAQQCWLLLFQFSVWDSRIGADEVELTLVLSILCVRFGC